MVLGGEVPVHGAESHIGTCRDVAHLHGVVAAFGCQIDRSVEDALPAGDLLVA
jgi:hypothetical protein